MGGGLYIGMQAINGTAYAALVSVRPLGDGIRLVEVMVTGAPGHLSIGRAGYVPEI